MGEGNYRQFNELFDPIYQRYVLLDKPILLAEVAIDLEDSRLEAKWVARMLAFLKSYPKVIGLVYFNAKHPATDYIIDWRLSDFAREVFLRIVQNDPYFETANN